MVTKKMVFAFVAFVMLFPMMSYAADVSLTNDGKVPGLPFQNLQGQIDQVNTKLQNIQLTPGPQGLPGPQGPMGPAGPQGPAGGTNGVSAAVHGTIESSGAIVTGAGFTVEHESSGRYIIHFTNPFTTKPDCIIQHTNAFGSSCPTNMVLQVQYLDANEMIITSQCAYVEGTTNINGYNVIFMAQPAQDMDIPITFICVQ